MRPIEPFSTDNKLPPSLGALMAAASHAQWLVMLADGRKFYWTTEHKARRFAALHVGASVFPPD